MGALNRLKWIHTRDQLLENLQEKCDNSDFEVFGLKLNNLLKSLNLNYEITLAL